MIQLEIIPDVERHPWPDLEKLQQKGAVIYLDGQPVSVAGQHAGTDGGSPSVWFRFNLPDGRIVLAQTTLKLLQRAADSLLARYGRV